MSQQKFYISDMHLGHTAVIKMDNRPFSSIEEMDKVLIKNWNEKVEKNDIVYILGDFCWGKEEEWYRRLSALKGEKVLIKGNHDLSSYSKRIKNQFLDIKDQKIVRDNGRKVLLSHSPQPFYAADYNPNMYMLYGHLHNTLEEELMLETRFLISQKDNRGPSENRRNFYNCFCGFQDWAPATLDEIIAQGDLRYVDFLHKNAITEFRYDFSDKTLDYFRCQKCGEITVQVSNYCPHCGRKNIKRGMRF